MKKYVMKLATVIMVAASFMACKDDETSKNEAVFSFSDESVTLASKVGSHEAIVVTTNSSNFTITIPEEAQTWLWYTKQGNEVVFYAKEENPSQTSARSTMVTFVGAGSSTQGGEQTLVVTQLPALDVAVFVFDPETLLLGNMEGNQGSVTVTTNSSDFTVSHSALAAEWLIFAKEGNTVTFTVLSDNRDTQVRRKAYVTFTTAGDNTEDGSQEYVVQQEVADPLTPELTYTPETVTLDNVYGSSAAVDVVTNSDSFSVTIQDDAKNWLEYRMTGPSRVAFVAIGTHIDLHNPRTTTVIFKPSGVNTSNQGVEFPFPVTQSPSTEKVLTIEQRYINVSLEGYAGAAKEVPVMTNALALDFVPDGIPGLSASFDPATGKITVTASEANPATTVDGIGKGTIVVSFPDSPEVDPVTLNVSQDINFFYPRRVYDRNGVTGIVFWVDPTDNTKAKIVHPKTIQTLRTLGSTNLFGNFAQGLSSKSSAGVYTVDTYPEAMFHVTGEDPSTAQAISEFAVPGALNEDGELNVQAFKDFAATLTVIRPVTSPNGALVWPYPDDNLFEYYYMPFTCDTMSNGTEPNKWYMPSIVEMQEMFYEVFGVRNTEVSADNPTTSLPEENLQKARDFDQMLTDLGGHIMVQGGFENPVHAARCDFLSTTQSSTANCVQRLNFSTGAVGGTSKNTNGRPGRCIMKVSL